MSWCNKKLLNRKKLFFSKKVWHTTPTAIEWLNIERKCKFCVCAFFFSLFWWNAFQSSAKMNVNAFYFRFVLWNILLSGMWNWTQSIVHYAILIFSNRLFTRILSLPSLPSFSVNIIICILQSSMYVVVNS